MTRNHQSYWILLASSCSSIICWHRLPKEANLFGERWIIQQDPEYLQTPVTFGFGHRSNFWAWYLAQWYRYRSLDHSIFVRLCSVPHPTCCCWFSSHFPRLKPFTMASSLAISSSMQVSVTFHWQVHKEIARDQERCIFAFDLSLSSFSISTAVSPFFHLQQTKICWN